MISMYRLSPLHWGNQKKFFEEKKYKAKSVHEARSSKMQIILLYFSKQTKFLMTYFFLRNHLKYG